MYIGLRTSEKNFHFVIYEKTILHFKHTLWGDLGGFKISFFFPILAAYGSFERENIRHSLGRPGTRRGYRITTSTKSLKQQSHVIKSFKCGKTICFAFTTQPKDTQSWGMGANQNPSLGSLAPRSLLLVGKILIYVDSINTNYILSDTKKLIGLLRSLGVIQIYYKVPFNENWTNGLAEDWLSPRFLFLGQWESGNAQWWEVENSCDLDGLPIGLYKVTRFWQFKST